MCFQSSLPQTTSQIQSVSVRDTNHGTQVFKERKVGRLVLIVKDHQLFTICAVDGRKKIHRIDI